MTVTWVVTCENRLNTRKTWGYGSSHYSRFGIATKKVVFPTPMEIKNNDKIDYSDLIDV